VNAAAEHLLAELDRIELLLRRRAILLRDRGLVTESEFRGLYVGDEHIDRPTIESIDLPEPPAAVALAELADRMHAESRRRAGEEAELPLPRLVRLASLSELEADVLLLAVGAELDLRWERLLAYVQDDVTRKRPTLQLALDLFCASPAERLHARSAVIRGPLVRDGLLRLVDDRIENGGATVPSRALAAEERVLGYLLGDDAVDAALATCARAVAEAPAAAPGLDLDAASAALAGGSVVVLQGRGDPGGSDVAAALAARLARPLLALDLRGLTDEPVHLARAIRREARLRDAVVYLHAADELPPELLTTLLRRLPDGGLRLVVRAHDPLADPWGRQRFALHLPRLAVAARRARWERAAEAEGVALDDGALDEVSSKLALDEEQTGAVLRQAARRAALDGRRPGVQDVDASARAAAGAALGGLARRVEPRYAWDDLVLHPRRVASLRDLCARARRRVRVYETWGFRPAGYGDGLAALFHGPSGTGKTMAAEVIASELGLDLYRIDLSALVSKYIGETEKNLRRIFDAAATANAILFFDEADALFGRRSEVKDAHDRYANIETAYLLGELETFPGVAILATNLASNIDDAFRRRIDVDVEFPMPDVAQRERIWRLSLPDAAPLADDVDLRVLAQRIEISGAIIRNACVSAAFAAADDGGSITLAGLVRATAAELEKLGRPPTRGEFGNLHSLI
jgi:ATPase family associated with various cellular activities (AAA)